MHKKVILLLGLWAVAFTASVRAQDQLEQDPGYLDLATVEDWFNQEATLEVNIKGALLELVAEASRYDDPALSELLHGLKAIQVRGYPLSAARFEAVNRHTNELADRLDSSGWDTVARVREEDEHVHMFVKTEGGSIAGLVVMVVSPGDDETIFVNIVGDIDPAQIGRIGRKFDIGPLHDGVTRNTPDR